MMTVIYLALLVGLSLCLLPLLVSVRVQHYLLHYPRSPDFERLPSNGSRFLAVDLSQVSSGPVVALLPGAGSRSRTSMAEAASVYEKFGCKVIWVDYLDTSYREGPLGWGLPEAKELAKHLSTIKAPLIVHGRSFGAAVVLLANAITPHEWTVVAESGFTSLREVLEYRLSRPRWLAPWLKSFIHWGLDHAEHKLNRWKIDIQGTNPLKLLRPKRGAILYLHGTKDGVIPFRHSVKLHEKAKWVGNTAKLVLIEGGRHTLLRQTNPERWDEAIRWAVEQACGKSN
jgi:hypothetical protein